MKERTRPDGTAYLSGKDVERDQAAKARDPYVSEVDE